MPTCSQAGQSSQHGQMQYEVAHAQELPHKFPCEHEGRHIAACQIGPEQGNIAVAEAHWAPSELPATLLVPAEQPGSPFGLHAITNHLKRSVRIYRCIAHLF